MLGPLSFLPSRVESLMQAKRFSIDDYLAAGFDRNWIQRRKELSPPGRPEGAIRLALWLEVPVEYLFGAAPEYDSMPAWEVAARASVDIFFKRHLEGVEGRRYRDHFERHIEAHRERSPKTVAAWAGWFDGFQRGREQERSDAVALERAVRRRRRKR